MADNVAITAGSGTTVATDDVSGAHFQKVKLADGTADSSTAIAAGGGVEASALRVTVASDSTGVLSVDDNGGSLTVDGTVGVSGTVTVDGSGVTQPVSASSLPLPSGAATAAKQPALGTAGSASTDVLSVQGIASMTPLAVDATGQGDVPVTLAGEAVVLGAGSAAIGKLAANSGVDIGDVDVTSVPAPLSTTGGGTEATALRVTVASDSTGVLSVDDGGGALTVDNGGTFAVQAASAGDVAHDGADSGNPVKVGMKAVAHGSNPTAVAAADRTDWYANRHGIPFMVGGHPNVVTIRANYTAAQTNAAIVSVSAGSKIVVTQLMVTADNANTVDVAVRIGFATATTPTTTGVVAAHPGVAPGGGFVRGDGSGILGVGADDEDLRITSEVPTTGSIDVVVTYFTIES